MVHCSEPTLTGEAANFTHDIYIFGIIVNGLVAVISMIICILTTHQLFCKGEDLTIILSKWYRGLTVTCIIALTMCTIGDIVHIIIRLQDFPDCPTWYIQETILMAVKDAVYYFANIMFYVLLLSRMYNAFDLNKGITLGLWILIMIALLASIFYLLIIFYFGTNSHGFQDHIRYAAIPLSITDFILNLGLFFTFWYQMRKTVIDVDVQSNIYQNIANVLTKHIVLFGIAIFATQLFYIYVLFYSFSDRLLSNEGIDLTLSYVVRSIGIFIDVLVLWLVLNINYGKYICCCKYCHLCVAKCCVRNNENPLQNPYHQLRDF